MPAALSKPKTPQLPPAPDPTPTTENTPEIAEAGRKEKEKIAKRKRGMAATILTSGRGVKDDSLGGGNNASQKGSKLLG